MNSKIIVITDADAKDEELRGIATARAIAKNIQVIFVVTGTCAGLGVVEGDFGGLDQNFGVDHETTAAPGDFGGLDQMGGVYHGIAVATGGQLFRVAKDEVSDLFELLQLRILTAEGSMDDLTTMFHASGELSTTDKKGRGNKLSIPIDSSISMLMISVSFGDASGVLMVERPNGAVVESSDLGVSITQVSGAVIAVIKDPVAGVWKISLAGSGTYDLDVGVNSPLKLSQADIVDLRFVYDDFAYLPVSGQPLIGASKVSALSKVVGPYKKLTFSLVGQDGVRLDFVDMQLGKPFAVAGEFIGTFALPNDPFRVTVTGTTTNGGERSCVNSPH